MRFFWKIFFTAYACFAIVSSIAFYLIARYEINDEINRIVDGYRMAGSLVAKEVEIGYLESRWPYEILQELSKGREDFLFWWVVRDDGMIYLANDASYMGTRARDYLPHTGNIAIAPGNEDVLVDRGRNYGVFIARPATGKMEFTFWLGFSFARVPGIKRRIFLLRGVLAILVLVILGLVLYPTIRRLTEPIEELTAGTVIIGKGDLAHRVRVKSRDELGQLASSFNKMAEDLEKSRARLVSMDLLEEKSRELENVNQELQREVYRHKQTGEELARSNTELGQFAYIASHDLQEPLRMVTGYLQLLERRYKSKLDADADDFIAYAVSGANRMQRLISDLLSYSRVTTRGKDFEPTDCELALDRTLANLQVAVEESGAVVTHDPLPTVMADGTQMSQLLQNLIGNAIKFRGEEPPRVHVSAEKKGDEWLFSVRDNGIGIDPEYADRIFIIFQRLHGTEEYPGTGIGLAVCKKIVERHGGRIWVESQPGSGSTFYFTIPIAGSE